MTLRCDFRKSLLGLKSRKYEEILAQRGTEPWIVSPPTRARHLPPGCAYHQMINTKSSGSQNSPFHNNNLITAFAKCGRHERNVMPNSKVVFGRHLDVIGTFSDKARSWLNDYVGAKAKSSQPSSV